MKKQNSTWLFLFICTFLLQACASSGDSSQSTNGGSGDFQTGIADNGAAQSNSSASDVTLSFDVELTIYPENTDDFGESLTVILPDIYELPMSVNSQGNLTFYARDFPALRYSLCHIDSTSQLCDQYVNIDDFIDMGLIFDSCDVLVKEHSECGDADDTQYTCIVNSNGSFTCQGIAIRPRIFFNSTTGSNIYTALPTQSGAISDLSRISLTLNGEAHNESGDSILLGSGIIPEKTIGSLPSLGLSTFEANVEGDFDNNPFEDLNP